jgi:hypothetical protein
MSEQGWETAPEVEIKELPSVPNAAAAPKPDTLNRSPDLFDQVWRKLTVTGPGALSKQGDLVRRRKVSFVVDGSCCAPDVFVNEVGEYYDFELTVQALNAQEEIDALEGLTQAGQVPYLLGRAALHAVNGKVLDSEEKKDLLWEALGQQGRQLVVMAAQTIGSVSAGALGKYQSSFTVA